MRPEMALSVVNPPGERLIWSEMPLQLKFLIGEKSVFSKTFQALGLEVHFTELIKAVSQPRPPLEEFTAEIEAIFMRSHPIDSELSPLVLLPGAIRYVPRQYRRYYISLQGSFEKYITKFSSKSRSTLLRKLHKFEEFSGGAICWREYRLREEMETFLLLAMEVSIKTYQERLLNAGLPRSQQFQREVLDLAKHDLVRAYILFHKDKPIAYLYCPAENGILLYQYLGYDQELSRWSPGTVLQYLVLERLFGEGKFQMFDFTEGEGPHKEFFSTGWTRCGDIYYFPRTILNLLFVYLHVGTCFASKVIVRAVGFIGLKTRLKRFIRSRA